MGSEDWLSVAWSLGAQGFGSVPGCPKAVLSQEPEKTTGCRLTALYTNSKSSKCDFSIKPNGLGCVPYLPALQFLQRECKRRTRQGHKDQTTEWRQTDVSAFFSCFVLFETGSYHSTLAGLVFTM